jgi:SEC-C motif domain protein
MNHCPCGTETNYDDCCGRYIDGAKFPKTPDALMRSRYVAFSKANIDYITNTQRGPAAVGFDPSESKLWALRVTFTGLSVHSHSIDQKNPKKGYVNFVATYREGLEIKTIKEHSVFALIKGRWYYTDRL